jgi:predicted tellurium resistance membrane protein TerC
MNTPVSGLLKALRALHGADVSMSVDNVLAVAGAARDHPIILIIGLVLSVILMGAASNIIARYMELYRWIGWVGLAVIIWVSAKMIWDGVHDVHPHIISLIG